MKIIKELLLRVAPQSRSAEPLYGHYHDRPDDPRDRPAGHACLWHADHEGPIKDAHGDSHQPFGVPTAAKREHRRREPNRLRDDRRRRHLRIDSAGQILVHDSRDLHPDQRRLAGQRQHGGNRRQRSNQTAQYQPLGYWPLSVQLASLSR
jgi:hypothetical protein